MGKATGGRPRAHRRAGRTRTPSRDAAAEAPAGGRPAAAAMPDGPAFVEPRERRAMIAEAAYFRAERRGFEPGHELEDWLAAEGDIERLLPLPGSPLAFGQ